CHRVQDNRGFLPLEFVHGSHPRPCGEAPPTLPEAKSASTTIHADLEIQSPDGPVQRMAQHRDRARRRTLCLFYRRTGVRCSALLEMPRSTAGTTNACSGVGWLNAIAAAKRACASCAFPVFWP